MTYVRAPVACPPRTSLLQQDRGASCSTAPSTQERAGLSLSLLRIQLVTMKFLFVAATAIATASAFTTSPAAFTTSVPQVGGVSDVFSQEGNAHRNRRSTIVMDGKANGE